jgi:hypothetical protein
VNFYIYGRDNPPVHTDPQGEAAEHCGIAVKRIDELAETTLRGNTLGDTRDVGHTWIEYSRGSMGYWPKEDSEGDSDRPDEEKKGKKNGSGRPGEVRSPDTKAYKPCSRQWLPTVDREGKVWGFWSRKIEVGRHIGTECCRVTCEAINDCMEDVKDEWDGTRWEPLSHNCRDFVADVIEKCCLKSDYEP